MNLLKIRSELGKGRSIFDLPLRVTFYARVSTDKDEQLNSLENQVHYYTELIQSKSCWTYIPGYVDEGISGTSTRKRESFLRMIQDAKEGRFDFIITKEISRFSRSTLDSIQYTQELLEHNVGVFFQNDNINTIDPDSEFRLTIMAGVAQDEVRKLSERLKFGFRQAVKNGHVLGNDTLWGYDKKDCALTINQREAPIIRRIFEMYGNQRMGVRKISQQLYREGYTSRKGNPFNELTIRHILCNPKYKGWYCAGKSQTVDYRTKRRVLLAPEEWVTYRDPSIPAIVSEELWDRANALYQLRSSQCKKHAPAAEYHSRYAYSGKICCEAHDTSYHRRLQQNRRGGTEVWECRVYHQQGKAGCSSPRLYTKELDPILGEIFRKVIQDRGQVIRLVLEILQEAEQAESTPARPETLRREETALQEKRERLVEMRLEGTISREEFQRWNSRYDSQLQRLQTQRTALEQTAERDRLSPSPGGKIKKALEEELSFQGHEKSSCLADALLEQILVKQDSTENLVHVDIRLKTGDSFPYWIKREKPSPGSKRF